MTLPDLARTFDCDGLSRHHDCCNTVRAISITCTR